MRALLASGSPAEVVLPGALHDGCRTLFSFLPFGGEIETAPARRWALERGITVGLPRVEGDRLCFYQEGSDQRLERSTRWGLLEPASDGHLLWPCPNTSALYPIILMIPALACTREGVRLGRGKGFYDRFLSDFLSLTGTPHGEGTAAIIVAACRSTQIVGYIPHEEHDMPVDCLWTEKEYIICGKKS